MRTVETRKIITIALLITIVYLAIQDRSLSEVTDAAQRSTCSDRVSYLPEKGPNAGDPSFGTAQIYKTTRSDISEEYGRIPLSFLTSPPRETTWRIRLLLVRANWSPVIMKTVSTSPTARFAWAS